MGDIHSLVKTIQNIMRKDAGVDGDAQRLSQLVWMLFLKIFDDHEKGLETIDPSYRSAIPEQFRWRSWAADTEGITGEDLHSFIDKELFPSLKNLPMRAGDESAQMVRGVFSDSFNYMKNGTLIRQVANKINEVNFNKKADRHQFGDLYEKLLKDLQSAGNAGEFYTPRPLTRFVVEMLAPELGETVLDPACGTGGFLINTLEYVREHEVKTREDETTLQKSIHGIELKPLPHLLATTYFLLHDVEHPLIRRDDMLSYPLTSYEPKDRVDIIAANPPFGGVVADGTQANFPSDLRTGDTALLFLILFVHILKSGGRAGIVLPDGVLFGDNKAAKIKEKLLTECNVHTIVRLPQGVFNPYAGVNTNLVFFEKGKPTEEVWYYEMKLPEGVRQYTKGRPITDAEFEPVKEWWGGPARTGRAPSDRAWLVPHALIRARNYNLDFKNPNGAAAAEHKTPAVLVGEIEGKEKEIAALLEQVKASLAN